MADNMKAELCVSTVKNACLSFPTIRGAIVHSDRGSQYTSDLYREELQNCGIIQSMNSDGGRCHDNARCEAMWARMKEELLYGRYDTKQMTMEELKTLIWRYYMIYWNTRRICSANGGLPPMVKRKQYYDTLGQVAWKISWRKSVKGYWQYQIEVLPPHNHRVQSGSQSLLSVQNGFVKFFV